MANLIGHERAAYVQNMFSHIANRYDLMNRMMTFGQDTRWRQQVIRQAALSAGSTLLDLGAGTGDLARQALMQQPSCKVIAADFTLEMMRAGQGKSANLSDGFEQINWSAADAHNLPFPDGSFDAVVSGFLMRNVSDVSKSLREQYRVLKPGGRIVILDTTPPPQTPLSPLIRIHMHMVIPMLGRLVSGQRDAYEYLPDSTENFLHPERLTVRLLAIGFRGVAFQRLMFGTIAIHWGQKPIVATSVRVMKEMEK